MPSKRTYADPCGIARALDLIGERWALLVVRELILGPKRFTDLRAGLAHLSPDVLAQRLRDLEQAGIVQRRTLAPPAGSRVYELTDWGRELEPVLLALGRWGSRAPFPPGDAQLGVDALVMALQTTFEPPAGDGLTVTFELRLAEQGFTARVSEGEQSFTARVSEGELELSRGAPESAEAIIATDPATLTAVLWHGRRLTDALRSGEITVDGSRTAVRRFLGLFPAPTPAGAGRA